MNEIAPRGRPWPAGVSGNPNARPVGSRTAFSAAFLRDLAEKTIDQAEKAFGLFFEAASKSMSAVPGAGSEVSRQALAFTEQNMKSAFEHARKVLAAQDQVASGPKIKLGARNYLAARHASGPSDPSGGYRSG